MGAPIGSIDPQYRFGDRGSSAEKIDFGKIFTMIFEVKNAIFFNFLSNVAILRRKVNIGFQGAFRDPKSQFPVKYHIFKHYTTKYRFSKNDIFDDFS